MPGRYGSERQHAAFLPLLRSNSLYNWIIKWDYRKSHRIKCFVAKLKTDANYMKVIDEMNQSYAASKSK